MKTVPVGKAIVQWTLPQEPSLLEPAQVRTDLRQSLERAVAQVGGVRPWSDIREEIKEWATKAFGTGAY